MAKSTIRFRDSDALFRQLSADIAGRRFSPIYLLMGEESYFIDALCDMLANSILNEMEREFSQTVVYGRDTDGESVAMLCRQMPMMGSHNVVIVKEAQALSRIEQLALYTAKPQASTILVICHKEKTLDRRQQLYKSIAANGTVFESVRPRDYEIKDWLKGFIESRGLQIDHNSIDLMINHLGADISRISNELNKLVVSLPEGNRTITPNDIETYIGISKEYNNFELCRAVAEKNVARAMMIADHLAQNPKEYPLLLTILALFGTFREIFIVNYLRWRERFRREPFPSDQELLSHLRSSNIYALRDLKQYSTKWNNRHVFDILGLLRTYDAKSKGIDAGASNDAELLRELLLKIFMMQ